MIRFNLCFFQRDENYSKPTTRTNIFDWKNYRKDRAAVSDGSRDRGEILAFSSWMVNFLTRNSQLFERKRHSVLGKSRNLPRKLSDQRGSQMFAPYCCPQILHQPHYLELDGPTLRSLARRFMELYNLIESHSSSNFQLWENISRAAIY